MINKIRYYRMPEPLIQEQQQNQITTALYLIEAGEMVLPSGLRWKPAEVYGHYFLVYCTKGEGFISISGEKVNFSQGHYSIIPSGEKFVLTSARSGDLHLLTAGFLGDQADRLSNSFGVVRKVAPSVNNLVANRSMLFNELFNNLSRGFHNENLEYIHFCLGHLLATFIYANKSDNLEETNIQLMVKRVAEYLDQNLHKKITLSQLAKVAGFSKGRCWFTSKDNFQKLVDDNGVWFGENGANVPRIKKFLTEVQDGVVPISIWLHSEVGHNQQAKQELKQLFKEVDLPFDTPKPVSLIKRVLQLSTDKNSIILDSFAGSGTTAHATLELNKEDGGNRYNKRMKKEQIQALFQQFESICLVYDGIECWSARELQILLGYSKWENFEKVIDKAKEACKNAGEEVADHFPDVRKTIPMPKGAEKEINDVLLTRYACYLIGQNGDSRKVEISFAQNYFAVQTRRAELVEKRLLEYERVKAPTISIKAKDLAAEMTGLNVQAKDLKGQGIIEKEHIDNNFAVREMLTKRGIVPENLPPAEDVKKLERKLSADERKLVSDAKKKKRI